METFARRAAKRLIRFTKYNSSMWSGDYPDWNSAIRQCTGYHADSILVRCRAALQEVQAGRAAYERDSLLFRDNRYCWELLSVMYHAAAKDGRLSVLDFGGALGSLFFQRRRWLADMPSVEWHVVEQPNFVECGRQENTDSRLRFIADIEASLAASVPNVLLLSGVLQALETPHAWVKKFNDLGISYIVLDRVPLIDGIDRDVLTVQRVEPHIYDASYPSWFFEEAGFLAGFSDYRPVGSFQSQYDWNQWVGGRRCTWRGYLLERVETVAGCSSP